MTELTRLPYQGVASFFGVPLIYNFDHHSSGTIIFLGVPHDLGTTNRPGARFGPRAVREASMFYTYHKGGVRTTTNLDHRYEGLWDINRKRDVMKDVAMYDAGDITIVPADVLKSFENITEVAKEIISKFLFPVFIGGDHSVTYPLLRAYNSYERLHVIHFDTHMDTWENAGGAELGHGSALFLAQKLGNVKTITHIGLHGLLNDEERYQDSLVKHHAVITAGDIHNNQLIDYEALLPYNDTYYMTIDIDVCDPVYAPGTGTPEFGGLHPAQFFMLIEQICKGRRFVGMDLVEVNPLFDQSQLTAMLAAKILIIALDAMQAGKVQ